MQVFFCVKCGMPDSPPPFRVKYLWYGGRMLMVSPVGVPQAISVIFGRRERAASGG